MTSSRIAESAPEPWAALARLRDYGGCIADWRRLLASNFAVFEPFLTVLEGTVAPTVPDPTTGLPLIPHRLPNGTFAAHSSDPDDVPLEMVRGLKPLDVACARIEWDGIVSLLSDLLGIVRSRGPSPFTGPWPIYMGTSDRNGQRQDAYFFVTPDETEAIRWLRPLLKGSPSLFVLPTLADAFEVLCTAHGHAFISLARDTTFRRVGRGWRLSRNASPPPQKQAPHAALSQVQRVRVEGKFNFVVFLDGTRVDFTRSPRRRAFLAFLFARCESSGNFDFLFPQVAAEFDRTQQPAHFESTSMRHGLFRGFKHFDRFFLPVDTRAQEYRLLVRRDTQ
jgi:hypothetical protein